MSEKEDATSDGLLIADVLLQVRALQNLLIAKGVITREEFVAEMESVTHQIVKNLLEKVNVTGDIDELIKSIAPGKDGN